MKAPKLFTGQKKHFVLLFALLILSIVLHNFTNTSAKSLFFIALFIPVIHQVFTWLAWRLELNYQTITKTIGFIGYRAIFFALFASRFISLFILAYFDQNSLFIPDFLYYFLLFVLLFLGGYTFYCVARYFGFIRATGADHFFTKYQSMEFVKKGIFKYSSNAMYLFGFLPFWAIAIFFQSISALNVALFSHLYIWVHYFCVEKIDMKFIYQNQ